MRGDDHQQSHMFSYFVCRDAGAQGSSAARDPGDGGRSAQQLSRRFDTDVRQRGRPSIPPEKLLRAQLLQMLYSIRSERLLMEEIDYSMLFRWFVGLNWTKRSGTRPRSPRTATDCWRPTWRKSFWREW